MKTIDGMNTIPYTFTITNTCSGSANYIVNLESLSNTTFQNSSIRVALDDTNKLYSEYTESSKYYSDSIEARTLISGTLENNGSVTYNLRMWIDEKAPSTEQNKIFASKIVVTSGVEGEGIDPTIENLEVTSTTDSINITYNANGDISTTCKYGIEAGTYDNTVADATATNCNITGLQDNTTYYYQICTETGKGSKCVDGEIKTKMLPKPINEVEIGDYISMTPTATGYTISKDLTGYYNDQTIDPSELNLWRIIKKNEDGTVDMVSEYVSSASVYFRGKEGYLNLVGGLNTIASSYTNSEYVQSTRHVGYGTQMEWCPQSGSCTNGFCLAEIDLVRSAIGSMKGLDPHKTPKQYWLSARASDTSGDETSYGACYTGPEGEVANYWCPDLVTYSGAPRDDGASIRPIVTLKSDTEVISGDGKSEGTAYVLD